MADGKQQETGCPHLRESDEMIPHVSRDKRRLLIAITLCIVFMVAEIVGGWISGSLAVITDAAHLLSDVAGFLISLFALTWSTKPANVQMSFGYHRAEILGALLSIALVWALTIYLLIEAIERIKNPAPINAKVMMIVATIGLIVNIIIALALHNTHDHNADQEQQPANHHSRSLNIRAALIHAIGDIIQSAGVLIAAIVIWCKPQWSVADPMCTFLFSILVFGSTIMITRDAVHILMEGSPKDIDLPKMERDIKQLAGVKAIHDLHVWSLAAGKAALTVHVVKDENIESDNVLLSCQSLLCKQYNIHHATIQVESRIDARFHCHSHLPVDDNHLQDRRLPW